MSNESPVLAFLNKMADILILNLLFLVCSLPIITIGPALSAMYAVCLRSIRYGDGYVVRGFFKSFAQNFKQSFAAWILTLLIGLLLVVDIAFWTKIDMGMMSNVMLGVSLLIALFVFMIVLWLFPVIAKIENKLFVNIKNAAAMAVGHFFPYTFICLAITLIVGYLAYTSLVVDIIMLLLGFALLAYILSFFFYKVFAKYMKEAPVGDNDLLYGTQTAGKDEIH